MSARWLKHRAGVRLHDIMCRALQEDCTTIAHGLAFAILQRAHDTREGFITALFEHANSTRDEAEDEAKDVENHSYDLDGAHLCEGCGLPVALAPVHPRARA